MSANLKAADGHSGAAAEALGAQHAGGNFGWLARADGSYLRPATKEEWERHAAACIRTLSFDALIDVPGVGQCSVLESVGGDII